MIFDLDDKKHGEVRNQFPNIGLLSSRRYFRHVVESMSTLTHAHTHGHIVSEYPQVPLTYITHLVILQLFCNYL